jgi:hypothetical protein
MTSFASKLGASLLTLGLVGLALPASAENSNYKPATTFHMQVMKLNNTSPSTGNGTSGATRTSTGGGSNPTTYQMIPLKIKPKGTGDDPGTLRDFPGPHTANAGNSGDMGGHGPGDRDIKNLLIACKTRNGQSIVRFDNAGSRTIPEGSRVVWQVADTGDHGSFLLPKDIKVGGALSVRLLRSEADADSHCVSKLM